MQRMQCFRVWRGLAVLLPYRSSVKFQCHRGLNLQAISFILVVAFIPGFSYASEIESCERLLRSGQFETCIETAEAAILKKAYGSEWPLLKAQAELALGQYTEAQQTINSGLKRYSWSLPLRFLAYEIYHLNNQHESADAFLNSIHDLASQSAWRYTDANSLVILGRVSLIRNVDPGEVLESFYDRAIREYPEHRDAYLASGNLALDKHDSILAQEMFQAALKHIPNDPDLLFGLAKSLLNSNREQSEKLIAQVIRINPNHIPAQLQQISRLIHSEQYTLAKSQLDQILSINPHHAVAWSSLAAIAHFENEPHAETAYYWQALSHHSQNPEVDYLIGKMLSEHYRFKEGAAYQHQALEKNPQFLPARIQLAQDQLRLGQEFSGWEHALKAHQQDGYDTTIFNLLELKDQLAKYKTLEDDFFVIRMDSREAVVYGQQVIQLLNEARTTLCKKYRLALKDKITVEIFADPDDFAVRTFGMPAISGYLGVCFGKVITANSPASQAEHPTNWQSVLWHEYCHVVTLELTKNKMPRWISEGISVYEEREKNPLWGETMTPQYREIIRNGESTPISKLSSAFLNPKSSLHIQFAYYQSSMVVEYIIDQFGFDSLRDILSDLRVGIPINVAIERHTKAMGELEQEFSVYLKDQAERFAPSADWSEQNLRALISDDTKRFDDWIKEHPNHFQGLMAYSQILEEENRTQELESILIKLTKIYPQYRGADNACLRLAKLYQKQKRFDQEQIYLEQHAEINPHALNVFQRLTELYRKSKNWEAVYQAAQSANAINPLVQDTQKAYAEACIQLNRREAAINAYQAILVLNPHNKAESHYQLARLLQQKDSAQAKRHTLIALEEAPRFRAAHELLLELTANTP
ncbi:MAG: peptidase MA family metallohydrolase [Gimesia sp.]